LATKRNFPGSVPAREIAWFQWTSASSTAPRSCAVRARKLSAATMRNIRQNLLFAFIYNVIGVPIAAGALYPLFGLTLSPALSAAAMSLSSVSVVTNALRLRRNLL